MNQAVVFTEYGAPEVLKVIDVEVPVPGSGQIRVSVRSAGIQPFDCLFRSGAAKQWMPAQFPQGIGNELAGVVSAVGQGASFSIGDEVLGWCMPGAAAREVVVSATDVVLKPTAMPWSEAGALSASGQTASSVIERLAVTAGETLLIHAAAGGVGSFAAQLAVARGAKVIGTASAKNHDYLRELGVVPVSYGEGLGERLKELAPQGIDASLIAVGSEEALRVSIALVENKSRISTVAFSPLAEKLGVSRVGPQRSTARLGALTALYREGKLRVSIQRAYALSEATEAHRAMESGHVRGKIVFVP